MKKYPFGNINRIVIAAPQGRSGKTTVTLGLLRAFCRRGLQVQPFKKGPDYIDPSWLSAASGHSCHNLDSYLMEPEQIRRSVAKSSESFDLSIIEGAMGLFDGVDLEGSSSTAEIARITDTPVVLVLDATRMTRTAAAIVLGCQHFDPRITIRGVILNKVARSRHEKLLREAIEHYCGIPVLGAIPKDNGLSIPDRHLGLITQGESGQSESLLNYLADIVSNHIDLDKLYTLAEGASPLSQLSLPKQVYVRPKYAFPVKIGVIRDKVFSFYYPENLAALADQGGELAEINSLTDSALPPDLDALLIGGGFPEVFAADLEDNSGLRCSIRSAVESGLPVYAECAGLMYLGRSLQLSGKSFAMAGVLPFDVCMESKPQGHGYTNLQALPGNPYFAPGSIIKGHEFHNSRIINLDPHVQFAYQVQRGHGLDGIHDGIVYKRLFASYNHLHALGTPEWAEKFVDLAKDFHLSRIAS